MNDHGGPAFPVLGEYTKFNESHGQYEDYYAPQGGMTLRDYFAAKALQGVLANLAQMDHAVRSDQARFARDCYQMADAMLKERAK